MQMNAIKSSILSCNGLNQERFLWSWQNYTAVKPPGEYKAVSDFQTLMIRGANYQHSVDVIDMSMVVPAIYHVLQ